MRTKTLTTITFVLFSLAMLPITVPMQADTFTVTDYKRHIEFIGVVQDNALDVASKIDEMSKANSDPITMLINSPGGNVSTGMILVDSMRQAKARGVHFRCLSGVLAASMAYIMFAECDERYAFNNTMLLWHGISLSLKGAKIRPLATTLKPILDLQARVDSDLIKQMQIDPAAYTAHSDAETLWSAAELNSFLGYNGFLHIVDRAEIRTKKLYKYLEEDLFSILFGGNGTGNNADGLDSTRRIVERVRGME